MERPARNTPCLTVADGIVPHPIRTSIRRAGALLITAAATVGISGAANAQVSTVERTAHGKPASNIQVGLYLNVRPDCTTGTLPAIRLLSPPAHGTVTIKRGKVTATNYKKCLALEVPGFVAFYRSKPDFSGIDTTTIEVKYPAGRTEIQRIRVTVGDGKPGEKI